MRFERALLRPPRLPCIAPAARAPRPMHALKLTFPDRCIKDQELAGSCALWGVPLHVPTG